MGLSVKIALLKKQQKLVTIREELLPSCGYLEKKIRLHWFRHWNSENDHENFFTEIQDNCLNPFMHWKSIIATFDYLQYTIHSLLIFSCTVHLLPQLIGNWNVPKIHNNKRKKCFCYFHKGPKKCNSFWKQKLSNRNSTPVLVTNALSSTNIDLLEPILLYTTNSHGRTLTTPSLQQRELAAGAPPRRDSDWGQRWISAF